MNEQTKSTQGTQRTPRAIAPRPNLAYVHPVTKRRLEREAGAQPTPPTKKQRETAARAVAPAASAANADEEDVCDVIVPSGEMDEDVEDWALPEAEENDGTDFATSGLPEVLQSGDCIRVPTVLGGVCKDGNELLVLAQVIYWFGKNDEGRVRARKQPDGYHWVAKTYEELGGETGLTTTQARHAVRKLVKERILIKEHGLFRGTRSNYLRVNTAVLAKGLPVAELKVGDRRPKRGRVK